MPADTLPAPDDRRGGRRPWTAGGLAAVAAPLGDAQVFLEDVAEVGHRPVCGVREAALMRVEWPDGCVSWYEEGDEMLKPADSDDPETVRALRAAKRVPAVLIDWGES